MAQTGNEVSHIDGRLADFLIHPLHFRQANWRRELDRQVLAQRHGGFKPVRPIPDFQSGELE